MNRNTNPINIANLEAFNAVSATFTVWVAIELFFCVSSVLLPFLKRPYVKCQQRGKQMVTANKNAIQEIKYFKRHLAKCI